MSVDDYAIVVGFPKGYQFRIEFPNATQLAQEADVRISGVPVGKVKTITPKNGETEATIQLDPKFAPIPKDAKAILRQKTLLGETYVELTPGHPDSPKVPEGGMLAVTQVAPSVQLDEIFRTFDRARGRRSRSGCRTRRARSSAAARTSPMRSATCPDSRPTPTRCCRSSTRSRARCSGWSPTPAWCSTR